jgi:hypothetical protein
LGGGRGRIEEGKVYKGGGVYVKERGGTKRGRGRRGCMDRLTRWLCAIRAYCIDICMAQFWFCVFFNFDRVVEGKWTGDGYVVD